MSEYILVSALMMHLVYLAEAVHEDGNLIHAANIRDISDYNKTRYSYSFKLHRMYKFPKDRNHLSNQFKCNLWLHKVFCETSFSR